MFDILPNGSHAIVALCLVAGMFVFFIRETYPNEVIALSGASFNDGFGDFTLARLAETFSLTPRLGRLPRCLFYPPPSSARGF